MKRPLSYIKPQITFSRLHLGYTCNRVSWEDHNTLNIFLCYSNILSSVNGKSYPRKGGKGEIFCCCFYGAVLIALQSRYILSCKKRKITTIRRMSIFKVLALCGICLLTSVFIAIHTYIHTSAKTKYRKMSSAQKECLCF